VPNEGYISSGSSIQTIAQSDGHLGSARPPDRNELNLQVGILSFLSVFFCHYFFKYLCSPLSEQTLEYHWPNLLYEPPQVIPCITLADAHGVRKRRAAPTIVWSLAGEIPAGPVFLGVKQDFKADASLRGEREVFKAEP
jgi:hypothetical protein